MELEVTVVGALLILGGAAGGAAVQVELLEDEVAQVIELDGGSARVVRRSRLPNEVREGDILVDGKKDVEATEEARAAVKEARARAFQRRIE